MRARPGIAVIGGFGASTAAEYERLLLAAQGEASVDGLLVVGPDGDIRSYNSRFLELWGLDAETLAAGDEAALTVARDRLRDPDGFVSRVRALYAERATTRDELEFADGRTIERYGSPVVGGDGTYYGYLWSFRDISDRRDAEAARELTRTIAENASSALFFMDRRGHATYANPAAERMFGWSSDELRDGPLHDRIHHTRPDGSPYPLAECPLSRSVLAQETVPPYEDVFVRRDGTRVPVRAAARPIVTDGATVGAVLEVQDLTAERRDRREMETFVSLVSGSADAVGMADLDRRTVYMNRAGCRLVGLDPARAVGTPLDDYLAPATRRRFAEEVLPHVLAGREYRGEWELRHVRTEEAIPVEGTVFLIRDPGGDEPPVIATVQRDIRDRRERERQRAAQLEQERRGRRRNAVLADVGHVLDRELGVTERLERLAEVLVPAHGDVVVVDLLDEAGGITRATALHADPALQAVVDRLPVPGARTPVPEILRTGRPLLLRAVPDDALTAAARDAAELADLRALRIVSSMIVPLRSRSRNIGTLNLTTTATSGRVFDEEDLFLLTEIGLRAGVTVDNARLFEDSERARREAEEARRRLAELHDLAAALSRAVSRDQVARVGTAALRAASGAHASLLVVEEDGVPVVLDATGLSRAAVDALLGPRSPLADVARHGPPLPIPAGLVPEDGGRGGVLVRLASADHRDGGAAALVGGDADHRHLGAMADLVAQALRRADRYERERELSHMLQTSLLPARLPTVDGLTLATHYAPGAEDTEAGGDWYDALELPCGRLGVTVGDVVGRGPAAAAVMGQLRSALSAFLSAGSGPGDALAQLNVYARRVDGAQAASAVCVVVDRAAGTATWASAGHPAPIHVTAAGAAGLHTERGPVLGVVPDAVYPLNTVAFGVGETLLAFSDGLFERRRESMERSLWRLEAIAAHTVRAPAAAAVAHISAEALAGVTGEDDVVVVAVSAVPTRRRIHLAAVPQSVGAVRAAVRDWVAPLALTEVDEGDLLLAVTEACANAVEHAYRGRTPGDLEVGLAVEGDGTLAVTVRDGGAWKAPAADDPTRGRGLPLMRATMDEVAVRHDDRGTEVVLRMAPRPPAAPQGGTAAGTGAESPLRMGISETGDALVVTGDVDQAEAVLLRARLMRRVEDPRPVVLDLRGTRFFGSGAVEAVATAAALLEEAGRGLAVRLRPGSGAERVLEVSGVARRLLLDVAG